MHFGVQISLKPIDEKKRLHVRMENDDIVKSLSNAFFECICDLKNHFKLFSEYM